MTYTENFFRKLPTPEEKHSRMRKYNLIRAGANAREAVCEISKEFFTKQTSKSLMDQEKCVPMLQKIMFSTPHMENLSDFVAICFAYTYQNRQSQPQSIELLRLCLKKNFEFENSELKLMMKSMIENPPNTENDMIICKQFIALICKKSEFCAKFLVQAYQKDKYSDNQVKFLKDISKEISLDPKRFSKEEIQYLNTDLKIDQSLNTKEVIKKTPTEKKIEEEIKNKQVDSLYSKFQNYQTILFVILTIFILLAIIAII